MNKNHLFAIIITICSCTSKEKSVKVGLISFDNFQKEITDSISSAISHVYKFDTYFLDRKKLPKSSFVNVKSPRYRADSLLIFLRSIKPDSINYVLGLTKKDISTTKYASNGKIKHPESKYRDWGVFGLGYIDGPSCVVSTFRYKSENHPLFTERLQKICVHEIGHNLGLSHCASGLKCIMQDAAETIKTIDRVGLELCSVCYKKLNK